MTICTEVSAFSKLNKIYSFWDTITTLVVPTIITSVLIVAILYKNVCLRRVRRKLDNPISRRLSKKQKSLVRITRVLLAISLTFVILSCPSHANKLRHLIVREIDGLQLYTLFDRLLHQIFQIIYYISFCFNFIYYLMWSNNFRKECKRLFCCYRDRRQRSFRDLEVRNRVEIGTNGFNITTGGYLEKSTNLTEKITMLWWYGIKLSDFHGYFAHYSDLKTLQLLNPNNAGIKLACFCRQSMSRSDCTKRAVWSLIYVVCYFITGYGRSK